MRRAGDWLRNGQVVRTGLAIALQGWRLCERWWLNLGHSLNVIRIDHNSHDNHLIQEP